jgi:uncharacterized protein YciI
MNFVLICRDKPGALQVRMDNRPAHLAYLEATGVVFLAGPLLDDEGKPTGSMIVLDVADKAEADAWAAGDPYAKAGLFEAVTVQAWRKVVG